MLKVKGRKVGKPEKPSSSRYSKKITNIIDMLLRSESGRALLATIRECHREEKKLQQRIMELQSRRLEAELDLVRRHKIKPQDLFYVQVGVDMLELDDLRNPKILTRLRGADI